MAKKLRVTDRRARISYPTKAKDVAMIEKAGGFGKLTQEQRASIKFKTVEAGKACNDLPEAFVRSQIECGNVEEA